MSYPARDTSTNRDPQEMTIGQLLIHVFRLGNDRMRAKMGEIGLHRAQGFALHYLLHNNGITQSELAKGVHITAATATAMLQRMERDGWIERRTDPDDQRVSRVYVTDKATGLHDEAMASLRGVETEIEGALSVDERIVFKDLLVKVHERLVAQLPLRQKQRFGWSAPEDDAPRER